MHRIAHPEDAGTGRTHGLNYSRQVFFDILGAKTSDQRQAARFVARIEHVDQGLEMLVAKARTHFDAHRIGDPAKILHMRAFEIGGTHANPGIVGRQVVPALAMRQEPCLRLLVGQVQPLVGGVEIHTASMQRITGHRLEEPERVGHGFDELVVLVRHRRLADELQVPVLRMMKICKTAIDQRTDEIERQRRALVGPQHEAGIGFTVLCGERAAVDEIASITRQRDSITRLEIRTARLGVLARHPPDPDDRLAQAHHQHQRHLQQDLELLNGIVRRAFREALGAVATLQQERLTLLGGRQMPLERLNLPGGDQWRQAVQLGNSILKPPTVSIGGLLAGLSSLPAGGVPIGWNMGLCHRAATIQTPPAQCKKSDSKNAENRGL